MTVARPAVSQDTRPRNGGRRQLLLESARELFGRQGYAATSTHAIAKHAGVSQSLVYRHFPSKSELFVEAVFDPFVELLDSFLERWDLADSAGPIDEITRSFTVAIYTGVREERELLLAVLSARVLRTGPNGDPKIEAILGRVLGRIEAEHVRAVAAHDLRTDPPLTARLFFGLTVVTALFDDRLFDGTSRPVAGTETLNALTSFVAQGVAGEPTGSRPDLSPSEWIERADPRSPRAELPDHTQRPAGSVKPLLLATARRLFATEGFGATSTKQIAGAAQVAESLLFHHFATKADLYAAAISDPLADSLRDLTGKLGTIGALDRTVTELFDHLRAHRDLLDAAVIAPQQIGHDHDVQARLLALIGAVEVQLPDRADLDRASAASLVFALALAAALFDDWLFTGVSPRPDRERLVAELVAFAESGTTCR